MAALIAGITALSGCVPSTPPDARPAESTSVTPVVPEGLDTAALVNEWIALVVALDELDLRDLSTQRPSDIQNELLAVGPEALNPLIKAIADPELSPKSKIWGTGFLKEKMTEVHVPELSALLEASNDATTRGCGVSLLSDIDSPQVTEILRGAMDDPEERVRLAATLGVARSGDTTARKALVDMYLAPDCNTAVQTAIINVVIEQPTNEDIDVLLLALGNDEIDIMTRSLVSNTLGRLGDVSALEPIKKLRDNMTDQALKHIVSEAITVLESIEKQSRK
jgi:HEAT repeat protein